MLTAQYGGNIERRRGEQFAAAATGDDESDDDNESPRRASTVSAKPGTGGQKHGIVKSLIGQETFKKRVPTLAGLTREMERNGRRE